MSRRRRNILWRWRRFLFAIGLIAVLAVSVGGSVVARIPLPAVELSLETTFVYDSAGNKLAELSSGENRDSVDLDEVATVMVQAVLAAEDRDFFEHPGLDASAIARATLADLRGRPLQGGSTITQQYVKEVFTGGEKTLLRKLKEAVLAVKLERKLPKEEILERYLNTIYFGRGAYGVEAAAHAYFAKPASGLGVHEAAYLAGLIRAPELADANADDPRAAEEADLRRNGVLVAMEDEGYIDFEDRVTIGRLPVASYVRARSQVVRDRIVGAAMGTEYFVEYVRRTLAERYTDAEINSGGLRVHTTLDLGLQAAAYDAAYRQTLDDPATDPSAALVAIDSDGRVRAMVGGRGWNDGSSFARVNFAVGAEGGGTGRQAGSAFKPFVLAEAVAQGYTVESVLDSPAEVVFPSANAGADYSVENYEGASYGSQNLIDATRVSSNTVYAQLADLVGVPNVAAMAGRLGIRSEVSPDDLSIALGSEEVSSLDMASAYLTFAKRGVHVEPTVVTSVTEADGTVVEFPPVLSAVLSSQQADVVTYALRQVVNDGTGENADPGVPVAGKTGTTQGYGDAWFVGYTPLLAVAVWMGYPEGQARSMDDVRGVRVAGGTFPAAIFRRFMVEATKDGRWTDEFVDPDGFPGEVLTSRGRARYADPDVTTTTSTTAPTTTTTAPTTTAPMITTTSSTTTTTSTTPSTTTTAPPPPTTTPTTTAASPSRPRR